MSNSTKNIPKRSEYHKTVLGKRLRITNCITQINILPPSKTGKGSKLTTAKPTEMAATKCNQALNPYCAAFPAISAINIGPPTLSLDKLPAITWPIKEKVRSISPPPLRIARSSAVITPIRTVFWLAISKDMRTLGDTPKRPMRRPPVRTSPKVAVTVSACCSRNSNTSTVSPGRSRTLSDTSLQ